MAFLFLIELTSFCHHAIPCLTPRTLARGQTRSQGHQQSNAKWQQWHQQTLPLSLALSLSLSLARTSLCSRSRSLAALLAPSQARAPPPLCALALSKLLSPCLALSSAHAHAHPTRTSLSRSPPASRFGPSFSFFIPDLFLALVLFLGPMF